MPKYPIFNSGVVNDALTVKKKTILKVVLVVNFLSSSFCYGLPHDEPCSCQKWFETLYVKCVQPVSSQIIECFSKYNESETLEFKRSYLTEIPNELGILGRIINVDLSYNNITELDVSGVTYVCSRIEKIILDFNGISVLKNGSLDCFSSLNILSIANNGLKVIETNAFNKKLQQFRYLHAQYNNLLTLDTSVYSMVSDYTAISVNVSYNKITHFTNSINMTINDIGAETAINVCAMHNNISHISKYYFFQLFHITDITQVFKLIRCSFDLRFNPIICECEIFELAKLLKKFYYFDPNSSFFALTCGSPSALHGKMVVSVNDWDFNCTVNDQCPNGCSCIETISLQLVTVHCGMHYHANQLPWKLPGFKAIRMHINNSPLQTLDSRPYLENVTVLDVSQNHISSIAEIIPMLDAIETIYLNDNLLQYMSQEITNLNFTNLKILTLNGNPFKCDCHSLWFKRWLLSHQTFVPKQDKILCNTGPGTGTAIIKTNDSDFICPGPLSSAEIVAILSGILLLIMVTILVIRAKWLQIQVLLIAHFNVRWFTKKVKTNLEYDIFISHSSFDDDIVFEKIIPKLENHDPPFVLCRDDRDFAVGRTIAHNIISKIESSLTTLLVVSNNFLRSEWCKMEFKQAHMRLLKEKRSSLLMIVLEKLDPELMDKEIKHYVNTHVYVNINDKYFWPKLLQALPVRKEITERTPLVIN